MSNKEMADRMGVHPSTISRYTADDHAGEEPGGRIPNVAHAVKFANALGTDVESLFGDAPEPKTRRGTGGSGGGNNPTYSRGRN
jgi:transcriptional regulator with XRE-family HTH domain